jgi:DNA-binding GntR family transcriptional regulator
LVKASLSEQIYRNLRASLMDGEFRPGERLTIASLSEQYGTSITPVREAISRLASEHALEIKAATSVIVPNLTARNLREIVAIRKELEGMAAQRVAEIGTPAMLGELTELNTEFIRATTLNPREAAQKNRDFHFLILHFADMPYVEAICENMWTLMGPFLRTFHEEMPVRRLAANSHQHFNFLASAKAGDPVGARLAMQADISWSDELITRVEERRHQPGE